MTISAVCASLGAALTTGAHLGYEALLLWTLMTVLHQLTGPVGGAVVLLSYLYWVYHLTTGVRPPQEEIEADQWMWSILVPVVERMAALVVQIDQGLAYSAWSQAYLLHRQQWWDQLVLDLATLGVRVCWGLPAGVRVESLERVNHPHQM